MSSTVWLSTTRDCIICGAPACSCQTWLVSVGPPGLPPAPPAAPTKTTETIDVATGKKKTRR